MATSSAMSTVDAPKRGRRRGPYNPFKESVFYDEPSAPRPHVTNRESKRTPNINKAVIHGEGGLLNVVETWLTSKVNARREMWEEKRILTEKERDIAEKERFQKEEEEDKRRLEEERQRRAEQAAAAPIPDPDTTSTATNDTSPREGPPKEDESEKLPTVRKTIVFEDGLTDHEQEIIRQRIRAQQQKFKEYERKENQRKLRLIWEIHPHVTEEEALTALQEAGYDEDDAIAQLTDYQYLRQLRLRIAQDATAKKKAETEGAEGDKKGKKSRKSTRNKVLAKKTAPRERVTRSTDATNQNNGGSGSNGNSHEEGDENGEDGCEYETRTHKKKKKVTVPKLRLDDAVEQAVTTSSMDGWSGARVRAWALRDSNPNAYYYRFNEPGEVQRNGKWTDEEKKLFFRRMAEVGVNGQWGIFAKEIPGRVGYQCANFYRQMIENGEIIDDRYVIDEKGKAHFLFKQGILKKGKKKKQREEDDETVPQEGAEVDPETKPPPSKKAKKASNNKTKSSSPRTTPPTTTTLPNGTTEDHSPQNNDNMIQVETASEKTADAAVKDEAEGTTSPSVEANGTATSSTGSTSEVKTDTATTTTKSKPKPKRPPSKRKKRGRKKDNGDDNDDEDDEYRPSSKAAESLEEDLQRQKEEQEQANPLPGFMDGITREPVVQPAISPYGHVLNYQTWLRLLNQEPKNTCPFTKKKFAKSVI